MYGPLNFKKEDFVRTNSICPTPESILLVLVKKNDQENIIHLVKNSPKLLKYIYSEYNKPILLIACTEEGVETATVKTLIDLGADLYYSSELHEYWQALHFAACRTKSDILEVILENLKNPDDINATAKGNTALHILIRHGKKHLTEEFVECARILVQQGIDVNLADNNNVSPILWAAKKGYKNIIKIILENSVLPVDLDSHQSRGKTARDIIISDNLYEGLLPQKSDNTNETDESILFKYLQSGNEDSFVNFRNGDISTLVNAANDYSTLLQTSCNKQLTRAVEHLIKSGANPNLTTEKNRQTPIEIAAQNGYFNIFKILIDHKDILVPTSILIILLRYADNEEFDNVEISHAKCYEILMKTVHTNKNLIDVNKVDESGNSPLHYAVRYAEMEKAGELLELGALLGCKNEYNVMPVQDIDCKILEKHLNKCIDFDKKTKNFDKESFPVTFQYRTLIPPPKKIEFNTNYDTSDPEANMGDTVFEELIEETEVIEYMSHTPEFKHLLKHPVIVSFLFMKWHAIRWLFYTNLLFYITFFLSLVTYIFSSFAHIDMSEKYPVENIITYITWALLWITFLILVLRELFQITVLPGTYFKNFENYIEIVLISFTGSILCISDLSDDSRKILSSLSILLAAFELVLMVGQHPKFSTNVVMFRTVSFNFFKFLMWYSLLIIAFALSFYILFTGSQPTARNKTQGEEEEDFFTDPGKSVFKTIVMLTGEFDAGSLNFQHFPITSKLIFSLFVFMIAIILLNLLNGLAVSDTQMIKNNAELVGHISRAQHIRYVERMALGNILPSTTIKAINSLCCCFPHYKDYKFPFLKPLAKRVCLFPEFLQYKLTFYPNKAGQLCLPMKGKKKGFFASTCYDCSYIYLDKETVKRTKLIIQENREKKKIKENYIRQSEEFKKYFQQLLQTNDKNVLNTKLENILKPLSREDKS